jgi:DNA sulfur modification protein DndB
VRIALLELDNVGEKVLQGCRLDVDLVAHSKVQPSNPEFLNEPIIQSGQTVSPLTAVSTAKRNAQVSSFAVCKPWITSTCEMLDFHMALGSSYNYGFAALRGKQAKQTFYVAMCPLRLIPKLFLYDEDELPPELRAQRPLNRSRIPGIARYILDNPNEYVFSSITASVDGEAEFEPVQADSDLGTLRISMSAKFIINDGQHRRAAIEAALSENPELGDETISVVLFVDGGLQRSQQMFADLNQYAIRPTKSIGILYDLRSPLAQLARSLVDDVPVFRVLTETERTSISNRSLKLFTLSGIYQGTKALLSRGRADQLSLDDKTFAAAYWTAVSAQIPEWLLASTRKVTTAELRREYVHSHGLALHALGLMGSALLKEAPTQWKKRLSALKEIDWSRRNLVVWEGRALVAGRVSKASINVQLTANYLKRTLRIPLTDDEKVLERKLKGPKL